MTTDVTHFVKLRKQLTLLRQDVANGDKPLTDSQRDFVAIAQAEALADLAATMNSGINVSTD